MNKLIKWVRGKYKIYLYNTVIKRYNYEIDAIRKTLFNAYGVHDFSEDIFAQKYFLNQIYKQYEYIELVKEKIRAIKKDIELNK